MTNITNNNKDDFNDNEDEVDEVRSQKFCCDDMSDVRSFAVTICQM